MPDRVERDFPLFPLGLVALPSEYVPLHIFEERFRIMIGACLDNDREFGIVWLSDDGLKPVGCACEIERVIERMPDGRLNILTRGTRPFRLVERQDNLPYPAGTVEFLADKEEKCDSAIRAKAHQAYADLVERATDQAPAADELESMSAFDMAATVDFDPDSKQGLLELRSENARLRLVTRMFRSAAKRLEFVGRAHARAQSNGKVRFE